MFDYSCHGSLSRRARRFLTRCLLLVAALAARGQAAPAGDAQGLRFFDIPALPLAEALQRFTASTGHSGLYDSGLVAGRRSRGVAGHYTAESALRLMLGDSGLQARYGSPDTFTLAAVATAAPGLAETLAARQRYYGKLQAAMRALLCGDGCAPGQLPRGGQPVVRRQRPGAARAPAGFHGFARARSAADAAAGTIETGRGRAAGRGPAHHLCDPAWAGRGHRRLSCITARARTRSARTAIPVRHARDRPHEGRRPGFVAQVAGHPL